MDMCRLLRATAISLPSFRSWSTVIAGKARYERLPFGIAILYPYKGKLQIKTPLYGYAAKGLSFLKLGNAEVLAGAINGRRVQAKLLELTDKEPTVPEPAFLDFAGVNVATASFLRETVLDYRDAIRRRRSNFYPVVANANQLVEDELKVLVGSDADVLMLCLSMKRISRISHDFSESSIRNSD
jgi:hypothetical protein